MGDRVDQGQNGIQIHGAFIVLGSAPIVCGTVDSRITDSHVYALGDYVPRWARRSRLRWGRPLVRRVVTTRAVWRWSKGRPGTRVAINYPLSPYRS